MLELNVMAEWLQTHQEWLALVIGVIAFLESLVVIGLLLPGVVMLFTAASLAGGGALDVWTMLLVGFVGAVLGDGLSFVAGQIFHHRIRGWWPFSSHPQWLAQGERFFDRHGGISIALGRFVGPIRPVIPVVAGMMGMPARYFYLVNIFSALVWAPVYLLPGYFVGASLHWQKYMSGELLGIMVALCLIAVLLAYCCRFLIQRINNDRVLLAGSFLVSFGVLVVISGFALAPMAETINVAVNHWLQMRHTLLLDHFFSGLTQIGGFTVMLAMVMVGAYWLYRDGSSWGRYHSCGYFLFIAALLKEAIDLLKLGFGLPRPELSTAVTYTFPSGHTAYTVFIGLWVGWYFSRYVSVRYKPRLWSAGLAVGLLVGFSRMYLAEHWLIDVVGGMFLGAGAFVGWLIVARRHPVAVNLEYVWWRAAQFFGIAMILGIGQFYF